MKDNTKVVIKEFGWAAIVVGSFCAGSYAHSKLKQSLKESGHDKIIREQIARINQLRNASPSSLSTNLLSDYDLLD